MIVSVVNRNEVELDMITQNHCSYQVVNLSIEELRVNLIDARKYAYWIFYLCLFSFIFDIGHAISHEGRCMNPAKNPRNYESLLAEDLKDIKKARDPEDDDYFDDDDFVPKMKGSKSVKHIKHPKSPMRG
jgi:hypothetical protein